MRELGILLVVWGLVLPPVAVPMFRHYFPDVGLIGSLPQMFVFVGDIEIAYTAVLQVAGLMIGGGACLWLCNRKSKTCRVCATWLL